MLPDFAKIYPEVDSYSLFTHVWMRRMAALISESVDEFLEAHKISSGRFIILMFLELEPEGLKPSELAAQAGVTQATVTGLIDGLEKSGHVSRKEHHRDGRACVVVLTERGRKFITTVRPEFNRWVGRLYSVWTREEQEQIVTLFEKFSMPFRERSGSDQG